ncbi:MAG: hypothetical protein Ct9H300mP25_12820 [Acidobacteriota bacterium]|nr:MAG: hypothetical protein Ct9H300mP25_12820 [Acidobacteriota bacterium]
MQGLCIPVAQAPERSNRTTLSVFLDGHVAEHWIDRGWPDDVLVAVPWLVAELAKVGCQLKAGQKILTGAWGPPLPLKRTNLANTPILQSRKANPHKTPQSTEGTFVNSVKVESALFGSVAATFLSR